MSSIVSRLHGTPAHRYLGGSSELMREAAWTIEAMLEALRYVETRCVSEAAYPHSSIEDRRMRDLVVAAIAKAEGK